jgi:ribosome-binding factor A
MRHQERGGRRHKDLQLCRQVQDALSYAFAEISDPVLDELSLVSVEPAPNTARLLVTLALSSGVSEPTAVVTETDAESIIAHSEHMVMMHTNALARLREISVMLRQEVTAEINRKRSPELVFRIV